MIQGDPRRRMNGMRFPAYLCAALLAVSTAGAEEIEWQPWSDNVFQKATKEHKLVLLDLEAVWCHWCHVMDATTYSDSAVITLIRKNYIAVRVDQDSRPDLANRYEDYGWPATVIFKWDGSELAKRRGYIAPMPMASMLEAFVKDPTPGPSIEQEAPATPAAEAALSKDQARAMDSDFIHAYDGKLGGWRGVQKFLDWNALEYCVTEGATGDMVTGAMARQTLTAGLKLIDPVWGGVDQYSVNGDWDHPHYEKIMPFQAENMRVYALAASALHEPHWLEAAEKIHGFLKGFLTSPEGAFYTSQDADLNAREPGDKYYALDDAARRKEGVPRVDRHVYARENGLAITGLAALYGASGDAGALADARRAAGWVIGHRALPGGGFRHDEADAGGPYLADTLEMGRAFLALYTVTAEREWLGRAEKAADFIDVKFRAPAGFATAATAPTAGLPPKAETDENITLARFANMLARCTGSSAYEAMAGHAMRYLASAAVIKQEGYGVAGILLANREVGAEPVHVTVVGAKDDPAAEGLFAAALRDAPAYTRLEWYDRREGALPNADVEYPALPAAAAFLCANGACSSPVRTPEALAEKLARMKH
jgi:uncharacterized protein YyaL (SSP411 family)